MAVEITREQSLAITDAFVGAHAVDAEAAPHLFRAFDDEGAGVVIATVGVGLDPAGFGFLEDEGEGLEQLARAEPDIFVGADIDIGLEMRGVLGTDATVDPVGRHHKVGGPERLDVAHLGAVEEPDTEPARAPAGC